MREYLARMLSVLPQKSRELTAGGSDATAPGVQPKADPGTHPLDLNEVVSEMEKMLRRIIGADIDVRITSAPALGTVVADRSQIEQVVLNLALMRATPCPTVER